MKKYLAVAVAAAVLVSFVLPAFAAVNPFMDLPPNHWAYDAIEQLSAEGVLSGYPDGTYKGKQPATRYEMASALARMLALTDMDMADKQDVEMLKRLIGEFKDELDAFGVKLDQLDSRVAVLENRLNGWHLSGILIMDIDSWRYDIYDRDAYTNLNQARVFFDRWFGEDESIRFHGAVDGRNSLRWQSYYVEFPTWFETVMTVGRFSWNWESPYYFSTGGISDLGNGVYMTDRDTDAFGISKSFALGDFQMYVHRSDLDMGGIYASAWEASAVAKLQFTERFGMDLGILYFWGDDGSAARSSYADGYYETKLDSLLTYFGGVRFDFNENIGFRGIYYGQNYKGEDVEYFEGPPPVMNKGDWDESPYAYKLAIDIKQDLFGFTSLWLGYDFIGKNFWTLGGDGEFEIWPVRDKDPTWAFDNQIWRIGAIQQWNDKWRTWEYFAYHTILDAADGGGNLTGAQWGLGVEYRYNPHVAFALNYVESSFDDGENSPGENRLIRFRTQVDF